MKFLNTLLENTELEEAKKEDIIEYYKEIKEKAKNMDIIMDNEAEFMFSNHILSFLKRIKSKSFIDGMEDDFNQVSKNAFDMAEELIKGIFEKENIPINKSEAFLIATHIEVSMQKQKEEK